MYNCYDRDDLLELMNQVVQLRCKDLVKEYWRFSSRSSRPCHILTEQSTCWDAYLKWHEYHLEQKDRFDFTGIEDTVNNYAGDKNKQSVKICASEIDVFKTFDGLDADHLKGQVGDVWDVRISNKAMNKLKGSGVNQTSALHQILALQLGYLNDATLLETGPVLYMASFSKMIKNDQVIVFVVAPERVPVVTQIQNETVISGFKYRQYIRIIDIVKKKDDKSTQGAVQGFVSYIQQDPDKWSPFVASQLLQDHNLQQTFAQNKELFDIENIVKIDKGKLGIRYFPKLSQQQYLTKLEIKAFQFQKGRWLSELEQSKLSFSIAPNLVKVDKIQWFIQKNMNREIIEKCTSQESCEWLLSFLEKVPNFTMKLTPEERLLITTEGNILCLGRSGTGKTTSAVLRLFALELLFKVRSSFFFKKDSGASLKDARNFTADDAQSSTGLHSVIVTASPVLTNEIRRFYDNFSRKITDALKKKEQKQKGVQDQQSPIKEEQKEELKEDPSQQEEILEQEEEINLEAELMDAEEVEKSLKMPHSMNDMKNEDFPAFLTIKRLVYMIDASLYRPFFVRNANNQIIGQDSQSEWHNEQKGVLMINNYFKLASEEHRPKVEADKLDRFIDLSSSDEEDLGDGMEEEVHEAVKEQAVKSRRQRNKRQQKSQQDQVVQEFAQEIDFELFEKKFWPNYGLREKGYSCAQVWTEIFSIIKGSHNSADFPVKALPRDHYVNLGTQKMKGLQNQVQTQDEVYRERNKMYVVYEAYEQWKNQIKGFDFMDIVNHILREMQGLRYFGMPIHFMLVDEVQDLTPATIKLLLKVTEQNIYFAGDTAQTIARGVGFRFSDLNKIVGMTDFQAPKVLQLTVNFRSHNQILKVANSIIGIIEIFFPQTIDKLLKEKSNINGLKPIILHSDLLESLFYILMGNTSGGSSNEQNKERKVEFGCDQVIIVRDQQAKKSIPMELQHALCLTVYESKGLEFDDVILFNFFTDSKIGKQQWQVVHDIKVKKEKAAKTEDGGSAPKVQSLEELNMDEDEKEEQEEEQSQEMRGQEYEYSDKFYVSYKRPNMFKEYAALCTELKQLYVCVTRPKKRLIIYDQDSLNLQENREQMLKFWSSVDCVDVVTEEMIAQASKNMEQMADEEKSLFQNIIQSQPHLLQSQGNSEAMQREKLLGWKMQGIKMFKRRFYEQAIKCFKNANELHLMKRAEAYNLAEKGSKQISIVESIQTKLNDFQATKQEKRQMKDEIRMNQKEAEEMFAQASGIFIEIGLKKQAAQCCFTSGNYKQAALLFEEIGFYAQAGESYYLLEDFSKAARLYNEGKAVTQAVECYKKLKNWDAILDCIKQNEKEFSQEQREKLIAKYVPLALNNLYQIVTNDGDDNENELEFEEDLNIQNLLMKRAGSTNVQKDYDQNNTTVQNSKIIKEQDNEEEDEEKEGEIVVMEQDSMVSMQEDDKSKVEDEYSIVEKPDGNEQQIDTSSKKQKAPKQSHNTSQNFELVSDAQSQQNQQNLVDQFEHLSQFDPEDELLKSRSVSVIESVISGEYKNQSNRSELSCYSILEDQNNLQGVGDMIKQSVNLIRTKRDIYAEDVIMTKIVYYVSQFSKDVQSYMQTFRSKEALPSTSQKKPIQAAQKQSEYTQIDTRENPNEVDLSLDNLNIDDFSEEFINIILDSLESFELYKLCIIVCNRFKLKNRIGRYLVSIAYKYSNIPLVHSKYVTLFHPQHKQVQEQVSFIAHHALHSALELIEPDYLKIKDQVMDEDNSLGQYCYTAMISLGYWKKLLYLMNVESGLVLANSFCDFKSFRQIYLAFVSKPQLELQQLQELVVSNSFAFIHQDKDKLDQGPQSYNEYLGYVAQLNQIVWEFNLQFTKRLDVEFPKCCQLMELVLKRQKGQVENKQETLTKIIDQISEVVEKQMNSSETSYLNLLKLYEAAQALGILILSGLKNAQLASVFDELEQSKSKQLIQVLQTVLCLFKHNNSLKLSQSKLKLTECIISGMLSVLKVSSIAQSQSLYDNYKDKVLIHYQSPLAEEITKEVEERRRKIVQETTKEVMAEDDTKYMTKKTIGKMIREQLRIKMQKESLECQVNIIDLDGNFMKAPLEMVLSKVTQRIINQVRRCGGSQLSFIKNNKFDYKSQLSRAMKIQTPFQLQQRLQQSLQAFENTEAIQRFMENTSQNKIDPWTKVYFSSLNSKLKKEEQQHQEDVKKAVSKLSYYETYLLEAGLMSEEALIRQKKKKMKQKEKKEMIMNNLSTALEDFAIINNMIMQPITGLTQKQSSKLLYLGQEYWKAFLYSLQEKQQFEKLNVFDLALTSFNLCIGGNNNYLMFMTTVQNSLDKSVPERKLLLTLLDAHIYKQNGDLLSCAKSLMQFVHTACGEEVIISNAYIMYYYEMILVYLLMVQQSFPDTGIYIPFRLCNHLSPYITSMSQEAQDKLKSQLVRQDEDEVQMLTIEIQNNKYSVSSDQKEFKILLDKLVAQLCLNIQECEKNEKLKKYCINLMTIIVNFGHKLSEHQTKTIFTSLDHLTKMNIISEEHSIFQYQSLQNYSDDFLGLDPFDQNEVLLLNEQNEQTVFVNVLLSHGKPVKEIEEQVKADLSIAEVAESQLIESHQKIAQQWILFMNYVKKRKEGKKQIVKKTKQISFREQQLLSLVVDKDGYMREEMFDGVMAVMKEIQRLSRFVGGVTLNSTLENVIDFHYLLTQIDKIEKDLIPQIKQILIDSQTYNFNAKQPSQPVSSLVTDYDNDDIEIIDKPADYKKLDPLQKLNYVSERIKGIANQVDLWSSSKYGQENKMMERNKKVMKLKWKEHALKVRQKLVSKVAGKKKEDFLQAKRQRIKKFGL